MKHKGNSSLIVNSLTAGFRLNHSLKLLLMVVSKTMSETGKKNIRIILWIIIKDMHFQFSSSNNNVLSGTGWANISDSNSAQQRRFIHSSWVGISVFIGFLLAETTSKIDSYILLSLHIIFLGERSEPGPADEWKEDRRLTSPVLRVSSPGAHHPFGSSLQVERSGQIIQSRSSGS